MVDSKAPTVSSGHGLVVGRVEETERLRALLAENGPRVLFLHGLAGVGKSTLLQRFATDHQSSGDGNRVIALDCREIEPTEDSFLTALAAIVAEPGTDGRSSRAVRAVGELGDCVVLGLDHYEVFRLLDTWMRQRFLPALPDNVSLLLLSRQEPNSAWSRLPAGTFEAMRLGSLDTDDSVILIRSLGVDDRHVGEISRIARGHPLTLVLGALTAKERPDDRIRDVTMSRLLDELTEAYLSELEDGDEDLLEAAAVVRTISVPLLQAMLPERPAWEGFELLRRLPFVEVTSDGLTLHSAVQESIAARLRAAAPSQYRELRRRAWTHLREELRVAPEAELWRQTADMIYLLENPAVREALFPTQAHRFAIEPASASDADAIKAITERHEPEESAELILSWWSRSPDAFRVARDSAGEVVGFAIFSTRADLRRFAYDPVVAAWRTHMQAHPIASDSRVLLVRRWLTVDDADLPSEAQAGMWLDLKRTYMELRPRLRRVYSATDHPGVYGPVLRQLEAQPVTDRLVEIGGRHYQPYCLDMGPASVDGWLTRLAARELGINDDGLLDVNERQLLTDGDRVDLTPKEFEVMAYLNEHHGDTVTRSELLTEIWGYDHLAGSNVVDVVVHALRKKLGHQADILETVRGVGYRLSIS